MCGRYAASRSADDLVEELDVEHVDDTGAAAVPPGGLPPDYNVAPTKQVSAVVHRPLHRGAEPVRRLVSLRWGLVPSWAKDPGIGSRMINARVETVAEKPAFKRALAARRCLLPADGYYEWYPTQRRGKGGKPLKQPFFVRPHGGGLVTMAGLYEIWRDRGKEADDPSAWMWSCTVLTTTATGPAGEVHDRMPLLVDRDAWPAWLDPGQSDPGRLLDLLVPATPGRLEAYPVSTDVNDVRINGPELVEPLPLEQVLDEPATLDLS